MTKEKHTLPVVIDEEVQFWISFIARWEDKHNKPATRRMLDALNNAMERLRTAEILASTSNQPLL